MARIAALGAGCILSPRRPRPRPEVALWGTWLDVEILAVVWAGEPHPRLRLPACRDRRARRTRRRPRRNHVRKGAGQSDPPGARGPPRVPARRRAPPCAARGDAGAETAYTWAVDVRIPFSSPCAPPPGWRRARADPGPRARPGATGHRPSWCRQSQISQSRHLGRRQFDPTGHGPSSWRRGWCCSTPRRRLGRSSRLRLECRQGRVQDRGEAFRKSRQRTNRRARGDARAGPVSGLPPRSAGRATASKSSLSTTLATVRENLPRAADRHPRELLRQEPMLAPKMAEDSGCAGVLASNPAPPASIHVSASRPGDRAETARVASAADDPASPARADRPRLVASRRRALSSWPLTCYNT
jgi:hypothetical protein